jgi:uncharacterized protein YecE (DUF72 family)
LKLFSGTSGYSYKQWKGPFYPERMPAAQMLGYYAERLPTVEINNTFYRMPKTSVLETWAAQVPDGFRFAIKASRRITHFKRLKEVGEETQYLLGATRVLGERLGTLLFQLPPNFKADLGRLEAFLDLLPEDVPAAFEFRHPSWCDEPVRTCLNARGRSWVNVDSDDAPADALVATGTNGYFRLRRADYSRAQLAEWGERITAAGYGQAFVFFKHEDEGAAPRMAREFLEIAAGDVQRRKPRSARRASAADRQRA